MQVEYSEHGYVRLCVPDDVPAFVGHVHKIHKANYRLAMRMIYAVQLSMLCCLLGNFCYTFARVHLHEAIKSGAYANGLLQLHLLRTRTKTHTKNTVLRAAVINSNGVRTRRPLDAQWCRQTGGANRLWSPYAHPDRD